MLKKQIVKMCTGMGALGEILGSIRADTHSQFNIKASFKLYATLSTTNAMGYLHVSCYLLLPPVP
jgi:hypothetical protein